MKKPDTGDMPAESFRQYGHQLIDWIADYFAAIESHPVLPQVHPGDIATSLPASAPEQGEAMQDILADIDRLIMPGMTHWNHPDFFAYFSSSASGPGVLAELLSGAFNINSMVWKAAPAATELEQVVMGWLRQMLGLPEDFFGIIYDGGSASTLHAIAAAREQADADFRAKGLAGMPEKRLRMYISDQAHSSVEKAALVLGLGREGVRTIPVDSAFRMRPDVLQRAISEDRSNGWTPFCVVATAGTTSTTSIDPIAETAALCRAENLWLHIDACYGGAAAILPEKRDLFRGWELADSIVVNPHKWMFIPIDLSAFYTRKPDILRRAFSLIPEYLRTQEDGEVINQMDYGIQLGRRFRSLKLWFVLRYFGQEGMRARIREHLRLARLFAQWVDEAKDFERLAPVPLSTVCFRYVPEQGLNEHQLEERNTSLLQAINREGKIFLSHTKVQGKYMLRMAINNLRSEEKHVRAAWQHICKHARVAQDS